MTARRRIAVSYMFNNAFARSLSVSTCVGLLDSRNLFIFNFIAPGSIVWYCIRFFSRPRVHAMSPFHPPTSVTLLLHSSRPYDGT